MAVKVTISLPDTQFREMELWRRRMALSRSAVYAQALQQWMKALQKAEQDRKYIEAYQQYPETENSLRVAEVLSEAAFSTSEWEE